MNIPQNAENSKKKHITKEIIAEVIRVKKKYPKMPAKDVGMIASGISESSAKRIWNQYLVLSKGESTKLDHVSDKLYGMICEAAGVNETKEEQPKDLFQLFEEKSEEIHEQNDTKEIIALLKETNKLLANILECWK